MTETNDSKCPKCGDVLEAHGLVMLHASRSSRADIAMREDLWELSHKCCLERQLTAAATREADLREAIGMLHQMAGVFVIAKHDDGKWGWCADVGGKLRGGSNLSSAADAALAGRAELRKDTGR